MYKLIISIVFTFACMNHVAVAAPDSQPEDVLLRAYTAVNNEDAKSLMDCFDVPTENKQDAEILQLYVNIRIAKQRLDRFSLKNLGGTTRTLFSGQPFYEYVPDWSERSAREVLEKSSVDFSQSIAKVSFDHEYRTDSGENKLSKFEILFTKKDSAWKIDSSRLLFTGHRKGWAHHDLAQDERYQRFILIPQLQEEIARMKKLADEFETGKIKTLEDANKSSHPTTQATPNSVLSQPAK